MEDIGVSITAGSEVTIVGVDFKGWVCIEENSSGNRGWLYYEEQIMPGELPGEYCILPDGTKIEPSLLFTDLYYYG
ncbi:hypothetical protein HNQ56_001561 [Anaerotaenia torta]|uniref:hypothetical protein n=1 Tax=Anaerotaenia torta TaxID=433293 RepID=UPI003D1D4B76